MMASFLTLRFLAFACFILGINATINPDEPFVLVSCQEGEQAFHIAPLLDQGPLQFTSIPISSSSSRLGVSYDPVDQKVYYVLYTDGAYSIDLDGSNEQKILDSAMVTEVMVDPDARKVYYINIGGVNWSELNGTGNANIPLPHGTTRASGKITKIGSRIVVPGSGLGILSLDTNGNFLTDEIYKDVNAVTADIDPAAGHLYWLDTASYPIIVHRQDIADYNSTCTQTLLDTTDIHGSVYIQANNYKAADMALYKGYAYVVGSGTASNMADYSGLLRFNIQTGVLEDIGDISQLGGMCSGLHIHAGHLYWLDTASYPIIVHRQDIADYNSTCTQTLLDTTDIHGSVYIQANNYKAADMALYKGYAYVVGSGTASNMADYSGLLRFNIQTGVLEDIGDISQLGGMCSGLHIHDPSKIEAGRGYAGGLNGGGKYNTTPVNTNIPVDIVEKWFGGLIADVVIPITGPIVDWHLELSFPRQVFKLEIQGCDVEISKETTIRYGRRKGTDFVIRPSPENRSPPPGEDLQIKMVAKTWKDVRGMKRGISAMFVPVIDPLVCDPTPTPEPS